MTAILSLPQCIKPHDLTPSWGHRYVTDMISDAFAADVSHWGLQPRVKLVPYSDVITGAMPPQVTWPTIVYSTVYSVADQRKHQSSASLAFVRGIHRWPMNSPHKWPVTRKMFPFDDVIMVKIKMHSVGSIHVCDGLRFCSCLSHICNNSILVIF